MFKKLQRNSNCLIGNHCLWTTLIDVQQDLAPTTHWGRRSSPKHSLGKLVMTVTLPALSRPAALATALSLVCTKAASSLAWATLMKASCSAPCKNQKQQHVSKRWWRLMQCLRRASYRYVPRQPCCVYACSFFTADCTSSYPAALQHGSSAAPTPAHPRSSIKQQLIDKSHQDLKKKRHQYRTTNDPNRIQP